MLCVHVVALGMRPRATLVFFLGKSYGTSTFSRRYE